MGEREPPRRALLWTLDFETGRLRPEPDTLTWARWHAENIHECQLWMDVVCEDPQELVAISTVFLAVDHSVPGIDRAPLLFETMVFGGRYDQLCQRHATLEEAETGHRLAVEAVTHGEAAAREGGEVGEGGGAEDAGEVGAG